VKPPREKLRELAEAAGEDGLREHAPREVDGVALEATLQPVDAEALGRSLAALSRCAVAAVVRGGGSRLALGNPPEGAQVLLSTERLAGLTDFDAGDGVCHVAAGTPLAVLRQKLAAGGWELPLDPPGDASTVGGAVAAAALGPRALGFGLARDAVLGLEVALASGERTRCGGRVVKNVTGYDLCKLYTGSLGSLGVIEAAWLRLRPVAREVRVLESEGEPAERACAAGLAAARRSASRAAAVMLPPASESSGTRLVVELAGDPPAVARDAERLGEELAVRDAEPAALEQVRRLQGATPGSAGLRFRIAALASRLDAAAAALREAGASVLAYPGLGLLYAGFALPSEGEVGDAVALAFAAVDGAVRAGGGSALLEAGGAVAKQGRDVFGEPPPTLALARALKQRFDPGRILNPGRFLGRL
jgi:glycolate oxidase FAD binding subunit